MTPPAKGFLSRADHALAIALSKTKAKRPEHGTRTHIDIDIIKRLTPSLQRHIGCDLIDVHPGVGLWSRKLHEHLKPRRHLLLEPELNHYKSFLQPLLDQPNSTYRLLPLSGAHHTTYEKLVRDGHLPEQRARPDNDPEWSQPNHTLLLVANLAFRSSKNTGEFVSAAGKVLYRLLRDIQRHTTLQSYGLVRMLVWFADNERSTYLPKTVLDRRKTSVEVESLCETVTEVASGASQAGHKRREREFDLASARLVAERMTASGLVLSDRRDSSPLRVSEEVITSGTQLASSQPSLSNRDWHDELATLQRRYQAGDFLQRLPDTADGEKAGYTKEFIRKQKLTRQFKSEQRYLREAQSLLTRGIEVDELEGALPANSLLPSAVDEQQNEQAAKLVELSDAFRKKLDKASKQVRAIVVGQLDDRRALNTDPPLLNWDRRPWEPLRIHAFETFPPSEPALLDFQPKQQAVALCKTKESRVIFAHLVTSLFAQPAQPVSVTLDSLAFGAADALIPQVPAMTDPRRGGRRDVRELKARMMTVEMFEGLVQAWEAWLFKPTLVETLWRQGQKQA